MVVGAPSWDRTEGVECRSGPPTTPLPGRTGPKSAEEGVPVSTLVVGRTSEP